MNANLQLQAMKRMTNEPGKKPSGTPSGQMMALALSRREPASDFYDPDHDPSYHPDARDAMGNPLDGTRPKEAPEDTTDEYGKLSDPDTGEELGYVPGSPADPDYRGGDDDDWAWQMIREKKRMERNNPSSRPEYDGEALGDSAPDEYDAQGHPLDLDGREEEQFTPVPRANGLPSKDSLTDMAHNRMQQMLRHRKR